MQYVGNNQQFEINTNAVIGSGSYGKVFECQSRFGNFPFQLCAKITNIYKDNKQLEKEVNREKEITEIVQKYKENKNLVQIYYVEHNKERSYLVMIMEKCITNLQEEWKKKNIYSDPEVIDFLRQFLNGYRALYEQNVIHRDIKPENILIQQIGQQKYYRLADFGIGRIYKLNDFKLTKVGTPTFASPELNSLIQDADLDKKFATMKQAKQKSVVDIYSLGILLHIIVTGGYPFQTNQTKIKEFLNEIKTNPYKLKSNANPKLINLIERMIVYDPDKRLTFDELYDEVNRITSFSEIQKNYPNPNFQPPSQQQLSTQQQTPFQPLPLFQQQLSSQPQPLFQPQPYFQQYPPNQQQPPFQLSKNVPTAFFQNNNQNIKGSTSNQDEINIQSEIISFLKKFLKIHKHNLIPGSIKIFEEFIIYQNNLNEIGKLYNNFDKNIEYNAEEIQFYYCLKYGLKNYQSISKKSYEEQLKDLLN